MSTYCQFRHASTDPYSGLRWCECERLEGHAVHTLPELPDGTAELTARITGESLEDDEDMGGK